MSNAIDALPLSMATSESVLIAAAVPDINSIPMCCRESSSCSPPPPPPRLIFELPTPSRGRRSSLKSRASINSQHLNTRRGAIEMHAQQSFSIPDGVRQFAEGYVECHYQSSSSVLPRDEEGVPLGQEHGGGPMILQGGTHQGRRK